MHAGSELEAVSLDPHHNGGLKLIFHGLSAEVLVEETGSPSECVLLVLEVVLLHVVDQATAHVLVVLPRSEGWEEQGTRLLMEVGTECPAGGKDEQEVAEEQSVTLLSVLDEGRVHMHVVLR
jgi:hypothetical protein